MFACQGVVVGCEHPFLHLHVEQFCGLKTNSAPQLNAADIWRNEADTKLLSCCAAELEICVLKRKLNEMQLFAGHIFN